MYVHVFDINFLFNFCSQQIFPELYACLTVKCKWHLSKKVTGSISLLHVIIFIWYLNAIILVEKFGPKAEVDNTLRDLLNSSYPVKAESAFVLLFIQNHS